MDDGLPPYTDAKKLQSFLTTEAQRAQRKHFILATPQTLLIILKLCVLCASVVQFFKSLSHHYGLRSHLPKVVVFPVFFTKIN